MYHYSKHTCHGVPVVLVDCPVRCVDLTYRRKLAHTALSTALSVNSCRQGVLPHVGRWVWVHGCVGALGVWVINGPQQTLVVRPAIGCSRNALLSCSCTCAKLLDWV